MSHNLEIKNGVASFAENGRKERAWHKLGQVFDGPMTVKEALELSHADYRVELHPVVALTPKLAEAMGQDTIITDQWQDDMLDAIIPNKKVTLRMDTMQPLGVVSDSYGVVQNEDAFKFLDTLITGQLTDREHTPVIETAGVLGRGERVFVTAKFPEQIILDNKTDDRVEMYVVFTTAHDGTGAVTVMCTPTRVVCNNTLSLALRDNVGKLSLSHSSGIMNRLDLRKKENAEFAYRALNMYNVYKKSLEESFEHLKNIRLAEKDLDNILAEVLLSEVNKNVFRLTGNIHHDDISSYGKNVFLKAKETLENGIGQDLGERGTGMWFINGLTSYFQNEVEYKSDEYKFQSIQNGSVARRVQKAYDLITM